MSTADSTLFRRLGAGATCLLALAAAACVTPPPNGSDNGAPPAAGDPCSLVESADFTRFQTDRDAVLDELDAPDAGGLIVSLRDGQEGAFRAMSVWSGIDGYEIEERSGGLYAVTFDDPADMPRIMSELTAATSVVEYVEYDTTLYPNQLEPNDPCYTLQWHYWSREGAGSRVAPGGAGLPARWAETTGARAVVVAVIDTGIAGNVDNSADNFVSGFDFISSAGNARDGDGRDPDPTDPGDSFASFHGTHVAGTVGSASTNNGVEIASVNWEVSIQPVRVLGNLGGATSDIIDAVRWSAGLPVPGVPANPTPARIINMSLGGPGACSRAFQDAIDDATAAGVLVIAAAGNDAQDASRFSPSGCANVFTVAAGDFNGRLARYSNFGATVELLAPGGDVAVDRNGDGLPDGVISTVRDGLAIYNGTSMAAPHAAGVAALLLAEDPSLSPTEIAARLMGSAIPRSSGDCPRPCGAGLLNAAPASGVGVAAAGGR
jgi:serine protease